MTAGNTDYILPAAFAPSAAYYAALLGRERAGIALNALYDKRRKETHRYDVADTRGRLQLTVPVGPPHGIPRARWTDVRISGHGRWQAVHATTLASAYGRTPYYAHYMPKLAPALLADEGALLADRIKLLNRIVCDILLIDTEIDYSPETATMDIPSDADAKEYWQIRRKEHGFLIGLSVLDLIFNIGPEAALYIRQ